MYFSNVGVFYCFVLGKENTDNPMNCKYEFVFYYAEFEKCVIVQAEKSSIIRRRIETLLC